MTTKQIPAKIREQLARATGMTCPAAQNWLINQLLNAFYFPEGADNAIRLEALEAALALLEEIAPQNGVEAMLAVQMVAIQAATMESLRRANASTQSPDARDSYLRQAIQLSGVSARQMTALKALRRMAGSWTAPTSGLPVDRPEANLARPSG